MSVRSSVAIPTLGTLTRGAISRPVNGQHKVWHMCPVAVTWLQSQRSPNNEPMAASASPAAPRVRGGEDSSSSGSSMLRDMSATTLWASSSIVRDPLGLDDLLLSPFPCTSATSHSGPLAARGAPRRVSAATDVTQSSGSATVVCRRPARFACPFLRPAVRQSPRPSHSPGFSRNRTRAGVVTGTTKRLSNDDREDHKSGGSTVLLANA